MLQLWQPKHFYFCVSHSSLNALKSSLLSLHLLALWRQEYYQSCRIEKEILCKFWMKRGQHTHTHACSTFMSALSWLSPWAWAAVALQLPNQNKQTLSILSLLWSDRPEAPILSHSKNAAPRSVWPLQLSGDPCHYIDNMQQLTSSSPTWLQPLLARHRCRKEEKKLQMANLTVGCQERRQILRTAFHRERGRQSFFCWVTRPSLSVLCILIMYWPIRRGRKEEGVKFKRKAVMRIILRFVLMLQRATHFLLQFKMNSWHLTDV